MGRRSNSDAPSLRYHKGRARLRILGQEYSCGPWGSEESHAERDRLLAEWFANGRKAPPQKRRGTGSRAKQIEPTAAEVDAPYPAPSTAAPLQEWNAAAALGQQSLLLGEPPQSFPAVAEFESRALPRESRAVSDTSMDSTGSNSPSVGEIASEWLTWIEATQCPNGKSRTSRYYSARQAIAAMEDFWEYPVTCFGSRELTEVQEKLVNTAVISRPKDPAKTPKKRLRCRVTINNTIHRIRQLFKWAATRKRIEQDEWPALKAQLEMVTPLLRNQTQAWDGPEDRTVSDEVVDATIPHLPDIVADLLRFQRYTGCRPGEAQSLLLGEIDMRPLPHYEGTWVYTVPQHKLSWRAKHLPRKIAIGPKAQEILKKCIPRLNGDPKRAVFSPRFSKRNPTRWCKGGAIKPQSAKRQWVKKPRQVKEVYSNGAINTCIKRACEKAGIPPWSPNQLRHTRITEVREGDSLDAASAVGGHSKVDQTQHYARLHLGRAINAAKTG